MAACRATSELDAPTVAVLDGRHARGTWTPRVVPGSGGRRYLYEPAPVVPVPAPARPAPVAEEPATAVVTAVATPPAGERRIGRVPIRYAPVPGAPRSTSPAIWGPPRPAWG